MKLADQVRTKAMSVLAERLPGRQPVEAVAKRNRTSKTFDLGAGVRHLSQTVGPQHYLDGSQWEEIDLAFANRASGLVSDKAACVVTVFKDRIGWRHESRAGGWWAEIELIEVDGKRPKVKKAKESETSILFPEVADGVEIEIVLLREGAEAFKNLTRPAELAWRITQSENSRAKINTNPKGKDADGNPLEMIASFTNGIYRERWTGRVSRVVDPVTRKKAWSSDPAIPVRVDASITEDVVSGADDTWEIISGGSFPATSYLRAGKYGTRTYVAGIRFQSLSIPSGATISSATLTLRINANPGGVAKLYGDDVDDAAAWSASNRPSGITKTTASVTIDPSVTYNFQTFNVLSVVQEVLGRGGWASNNDVRFGLFNNGTNYFSFAAFEEISANTEPQLDITYTTGGGSAIPVFMNHYRQQGICG